MPNVRLPLNVKAASRNASRNKGTWGVNCFIDGERMQKRFGTSYVSQTDLVGQGLYNWANVLVEINNDVLYVAGDPFPL
jgi:hypothetical protein